MFLQTVFRFCPPPAAGLPSFLECNMQNSLYQYRKDTDHEHFRITDSHPLLSHREHPMQIELDKSVMHLEEMPLDVGYASEKVTLINSEGQTCVIGGQNGKTQLIITAPFIDDDLRNELNAINGMLPQGGEHVVTAALVVANSSHTNPELGKFNFYIDSNNEFGDFYGVRLAGEPCGGELTKALILVSKDGAIFYDEFAKNLHDNFDTDTLLRKISAAQTCYTGQGCHS
jgi:peroxiredoxin